MAPLQFAPSSNVSYNLGGLDVQLSFVVVESGFRENISEGNGTRKKPPSDIYLYLHIYLYLTTVVLVVNGCLWNCLYMAYKVSTNILLLCYVMCA